MTELYEIIPGRLWQSGSVQGREGEGEVLDLGIDYVVNLNGDPPFSGGGGRGPFTELRWQIEDGPLPDREDLDEVVSRVCSAVSSGGRVLVHCAAGLNRSSLVNAMAVHKLTGRSGPELIRYMRSRRPGALTNGRFISFLERLGKH
jgi:hypothetical protein